MSANLAGVTLLALGASAPDFATIYVSFQGLNLTLILNNLNPNPHLNPNPDPNSNPSSNPNP